MFANADSLMFGLTLISSNAVATLICEGEKTFDPSS